MNLEKAVNHGDTANQESGVKTGGKSGPGLIPDT
jgi:hypothetical protein